MNKNDKILIAGRGGLVGSSIEQALKASGYTNIIGARSSEVDLRKQDLVESYFASEQPDVVILSAAKVGGIMANIKYYINEAPIAGASLYHKR